MTPGLADVADLATCAPADWSRIRTMVALRPRHVLDGSLLTPRILDGRRVGLPRSVVESTQALFPELALLA